MANYNLVVNSKFQPFSFERYIQPYQMYEEAYKDVENALGELSASASIWEKLANEQTDKEVYNMYKAYADDLNRSVEDLTKYGLNASSRRDLLNLRSRYRKEITPIEQAFNLRRQHIDEQRKVRQADNTVEFDMDASTARLIDYINNPSMTYTPVSKGLVTKRVADAVKNYSNTMLRNPSAWRNTASGQLLERILQYGLTNADVQEIINNPNAFPEIQKLMSDVVESTGVSSWNKPATLEAVKAAAREGLFAGLGKTIVDVQKNSNYLNDYEQWKWEQEKLKLAPEDPAENTDSSGISYGARLLEGVTGEDNKYLDVLEGLRKTPEGYSTNKLDELNRRINEVNKAMSSFSPEDIKKYTIHESALSNQKGRNSYANLGKQMSASTAVPARYGEYKKKRAEYESIMKEAGEVLNALKVLEDKYSHLAPSPYEALQKGMKLDVKQKAQEKSSFPLTIKESDYKNVRAGIGNVILAAGKETIDRGGIGLVDSDGETLSYDKTKEVLAGDTPFLVKMSGGNKPQMTVVHNGEEYTIKGIEQIDQYNRDLKVTQNYLKDFSKEGVQRRTIISNDELNDIYTKGIDNTRISDMNIQKIPESDFYGSVLYNPSTGEHIKVIMDYNKNIIGTSYLSDEIHGGKIRDRYFIEMANKGLRALPELVATE